MTVSSALASFAVVAGMLTIMPGLDTALVLRSAITQGRRRAFATALGILCGVLVWGMAAAVGASAVLTASHLLYDALRVAGAVYLGWLGIGMLRRTLAERRRPASQATADAGGAATAEETWARSWARGLGTSLLNPKNGVFYMAMLPQFIPAGAPHLLMGVVLAALHDLEGLVWFSALIFGTQLVRRWLDRASVRRAIDAITGTVLVGFGIKLALADN
ncbi:threonine/homoserine/homoserine lactone efflux protein [Streptomyces sp. 3211.6]|uniref:LysE family translocator n=1 Tax=Streptomyces TaxID=1883 RepID=UPI0009A51A04|nr:MULTISPECIES: LysE family translocator [Streptomyces]RKT08581.1 threonine/homoserine/homoserine lactone efflux protein [Streptomyces sp. 3211.6]RPF29978.1 threonine/homoserine/homoserine lactone efflux protein [Streptomyces sp. Ag109_G2-6]